MDSASVRSCPHLNTSSIPRRVSSSCLRTTRDGNDPDPTRARAAVSLPGRPNPPTNRQLRLLFGHESVCWELVSVPRHPYRHCTQVSWMPLNVLTRHDSECSFSF